jgi:hypothetical protein
MIDIQVCDKNVEGSFVFFKQVSLRSGLATRSFRHSLLAISIAKIFEYGFR